MGRKKLTDEQRLEVALAALKGEEISSVCTRYELSQAAVYKIRDRALKALRAGMRRGASRKDPLRVLQKENAKLKELVGDYALANEILKKKGYRLGILS